MRCLGGRGGLARRAQGGHGRIDLLEGGDPPVAQHLKKRNQHIAHRGRVVIGPVVVEGGQVEVLGHDVQLVLAQLGQQVLGQDQAVDGGVGKGYPHPAAALGNEAQVKLGVVGRQGPARRKVEKGLDGLGLGGGPGEHLVGDAGELRDLPGQGTAGIGKGGEFLHHRAIPQHHRADLGDDVPGLVQSGGLDVKADNILCKVLFLVAMDRHAVVHVVDVIGLDPVEDLDLLGRVPGVGERVGHAVVGNGDGPVAPPLRPLDHVLVHADGRVHLAAHRRQRVHGGHVGVEVELHPLLRRVVLPLFPGALHDDVGLQHHVAGKAVDVQLALDEQPLALLHPVHDGLSLFAGEEL